MYLDNILYKHGLIENMYHCVISAIEVEVALDETCDETTCVCQSCDSPWFQHDDDECNGYKIAIAIVHDINITDRRV